MSQHDSYVVRVWRAPNPTRSGEGWIGCVLRVEVEDVRSGDRHALKGLAARAFGAALEAARAPGPQPPRRRAGTGRGQVARVACGTPGERSTSTMAS